MPTGAARGDMSGDMNGAHERGDGHHDGAWEAGTLAPLSPLPHMDGAGASEGTPTPATDNSSLPPERWLRDDTVDELRDARARSGLARPARVPSIPRPPLAEAPRQIRLLSCRSRHHPAQREPPVHLRGRGRRDWPANRHPGRPRHPSRPPAHPWAVTWLLKRDVAALCAGPSRRQRHAQQLRRAGADERAVLVEDARLAEQHAPSRTHTRPFGAQASGRDGAHVGDLQIDRRRVRVRIGARDRRAGAG